VIAELSAATEVFPPEVGTERGRRRARNRETRNEDIAMPKDEELTVTLTTRRLAEVREFAERRQISLDAAVDQLVNHGLSPGIGVPRS
jgi:hypothetical protein